MSFVSQQYTFLLSPNGQRLASPRVGSDLCLHTQFCSLWDHNFLPSGACPLVGEAGLEACAGFLVRGASACLLVGGPGSWSSCGQGHVKGCVYSWLWAQEVFGQHVCWWVWLYSHLVCCLAWGIPALEPTGCWVRPGLSAKDPSKIYSSSQSSHRWTLPDMSTTSFYDPRESHSCSLPSQETLQDQQVSLAQASMKSLLLPWVPVCIRTCVCPPRLESLFPPVLWSSCNQAPLTFKAKYSGGSTSWFWGACHGAQSSHSCGRTSVTWLFSSLWVTHLGGMGFGYITSVPLIPSHCGFFFVSLDVEYLVLNRSLLEYNCFTILC